MPGRRIYAKGIVYPRTGFSAIQGLYMPMLGFRDKHNALGRGIQGEGGCRVKCSHSYRVINQAIVYRV